MKTINQEPKINQFVKTLKIILPRKFLPEERDDIFRSIKEDLTKKFEFDIGFHTEIRLSPHSNNENVEAVIEGYLPIGEKNGHTPSTIERELSDKYSKIINDYLQKHPPKSRS